MSEKLNKKGLERLWDKILLLADYIQGKISALEKSMPEQAKNGKLTIQKNGTEVQTFSANQGTDATANILVPTISNSAAVTQTGQMALDATEKNASIEGTLAHQIAQVNGNLTVESGRNILVNASCTGGTTQTYTISNDSVSNYRNLLFMLVTSGVTLASNVLDKNLFKSGQTQRVFWYDLSYLYYVDATYISDTQIQLQAVFPSSVTLGFVIVGFN